VTRFIDGEPVSDAAVRQPEMLRRIARALHRVHAAGVIGAAFSAFRVVEAYAETAVAQGVPLPDAYERAQTVAREIEGALAVDEPCFCHNDLLNANFIDDGQQIRIVDWEYAGMGDRFFDFGNFAVNHQLGEGDERILLEAYFGAVSPRAHARLRLMRVMSDFREAMWGVVQQGISALEVDFGGYAARHFDRLLRAVEDPRYREWLSACAA
jgi:thiamine kinase-like enzyme